MSNLATYFGPCEGGPLDQQQLEHWRTIKPYILYDNFEPTTLGEYRFDLETTTWKWYPCYERS